jgi:hypothetical protein
MMIATRMMLLMIRRGMRDMKLAELPRNLFQNTLSLTELFVYLWNFCVREMRL